MGTAIGGFGFSMTGGGGGVTAFPLQPEDDLQDENAKMDVSVIDGVVGRCTLRTTTALERGALPGYDDFQTSQLSQMIRSKR